MTVRPVLLLGDPALYQVASAVTGQEIGSMGRIIRDLRDTLADFRSRRGTGSAIAAPQIGVPKRLVYVSEPGLRAVLVNPEILPEGTGTVEGWESCMSFPDLLVKTRRYRSSRLTFRDESWTRCVLVLTGNLSTVAQHECDHIDGVLAVARAVDARSFCLACRQRLAASGVGSWFAARQIE